MTFGGMGKTRFAPPDIPVSNNLAATSAEPDLSTFIQTELPRLQDPRLQQELESISRERDPELLAKALLTFGIRQEQAGNIELAAQVYSKIAAAGSYASSAQQHLDGMLGQGSVGPRAEFLLRRLAGDSTSPAMLLGMAGAGFLGKLSYAGILGRLSTGPASIYSRGLLAKAIAASGALLFEAPAFTLLSKGTETALGHSSSWAPRELAMETLNGAILLGALKFSHALGTQAIQGLAGINSKLSATVFPQATTLTGIILARKAQEALGLKERGSNDTLLTDALANLIQFHVAGKWNETLLGKNYQAWLQGLEWRVSASGTVPTPTGLQNLAIAPLPLGASATPLGLGPQIYMMGDMGSKGPSWLERLQSNAPRSVRVSYVDRSPLTAIPNILETSQLADLEKHSEKILDATLRARALAELGTESIRSNDPVRAQSSFRQARELLETLPPSRERGLALSHVALELAKSANPFEAQELFRKVVREAHGLRTGTMSTMLVERFQASYELYTTLALHLKMVGQDPESEQMFYAAEKVAEQIPEWSSNLTASDAARRLAGIGFTSEAMRYLERIRQADLYIATMAEIGLAAMKHGDSLLAEGIIGVLPEAEADQLRSALVLQLLREGRLEQFKHYLHQIQAPKWTIETLFQSAELARHMGDVMHSDKLLIGSRGALDKHYMKLTQDFRIKMYASVARYLASQGDPEAEEFEFMVRKELPWLLASNRPKSPELIDAVAEFLQVLIYRGKGDQTANWVQKLSPETKHQVFGKASRALAEAGWTHEAEVLLRQIPLESRASYQQSIALKYLELHLDTAALRLAEEILDPQLRFATVLEIFRKGNFGSGHLPPGDSGSKLGSSNRGPVLDPKSGSESKGNAPLSPAINSLGSGPDLSPELAPGKHQSKLLWEPDASSLAFAGELLQHPAAKLPPTPAQLELHLDGDVRVSHAARPETKWLASEHMPGDREPVLNQRPSSDPPNDNGIIGKDALHWANAQQRNPDIQLVSHLAAKIRCAMWDALHLHLESLTARAISRDGALTVRLVPLDGSLENYQVILFPGIQAQTEAQHIQFTLNTKTGDLKPLEYAPHGIWEFRQKLQGADVSRGFVPFYRSIRGFGSEGLKASPLMETLPSDVREYLQMEPTRKPVTVPRSVSLSDLVTGTAANPIPSEPEGPTLLVQYSPRILAGARESVDEFIREMLIPEQYQRRLHSLVHHVLLALHQRETLDPKVGSEGAVFVWIRRSEENGGKRRLEVVTRAEAMLKPPGEKDILLQILRYPVFYTPDQVYPVLTHEYLRTDAKKNLQGADLEFQRDLGLGDMLKLNLRIPHLKLDPSAEELGEWEQWMQDNGYREADPNSNP